MNWMLSMFTFISASNSRTAMMWDRSDVWLVASELCVRRDFPFSRLLSPKCHLLTRKILYWILRQPFLLALNPTVPRYVRLSMAVMLGPSKVTWKSKCHYAGWLFWWNEIFCFVIDLHVFNFAVHTNFSSMWLD